MSKPDRSTRRILSAGVGVAAITALAGLACGNPVEPCAPSTCEPVDAATIDGPPGDGPNEDALPDAPELDAGVDAPPAALDVPQP